MQRVFASACAALAVALIVQTKASAQTGDAELLRLSVGQRIEGPALSGRSANGRPVQCFIFDAEPGASYKIEYRVSGGGEFFLSIASSCDRDGETYQSIVSDSVFKNPLVFTAGGGRYYLRLSSSRANTSPGWSLSAQRVEQREARITLPLILTAPEGVASILSSGAPRTAGETFRDCPTCPSLTVIPAGSYMMGSPPIEENRNSSEGPRHLVTIGRAFALGQYEVTFDEYDACVAAEACRQLADQGWGRGRRPVINVSYRDAQRYVAWLSQTTGQRYFLPSEAEWEYAARAGTDTPWNTGSAIIGDDANLLNAFGRTTPVGSYPPNAFGLHDMHGNVAEWTQDCADTGYLGVPTDGSAATSGDCATSRVLRGGDYRSLPNDARSARRQLQNDAPHPPGRGFRVARAL